jgi:hypothetical protein
VPQVASKQAAVPQIQLAATDGPGALLGAFLRNQLENCSQICPFMVQGLFTVPIAGVQAPFVFVDAVATQPLLQAIGTAAASVSQPANDAAEGIINNDLDEVLPPLRTPTLPAGATTPVQRAAVKTIEIASANAFHAGELALLGIVQAANAATTTLSRTGSLAAAASATNASINQTVTAARGAINTAVNGDGPVASPSPTSRRSSPSPAPHNARQQTSRTTATNTSVKHNRITKPLHVTGEKTAAGAAGRPGSNAGK